MKIYIEKREKKDKSDVYLVLVADFEYRKVSLSYDTTLMMDFCGIYGSEFLKFFRSLDVGDIEPIIDTSLNHEE